MCAEAPYMGMPGHASSVHQTEVDSFTLSWPTKEKYLCANLFTVLPEREHMSWINAVRKLLCRTE